MMILDALRFVILIFFRQQNHLYICQKISTLGSHNPGMDGEAIFYGAGRGREPPLPTVRGRAGKGSKSAGRGGAGAGNILRVSAD